MRVMDLWIGYLGESYGLEMEVGDFLVMGEFNYVCDCRGFFLGF